MVRYEKITVFEDECYLFHKNGSVQCQDSITAIRFKEIDDEVMHVRSDIRRYPFTMTLTFVAVT